MYRIAPVLFLLIFTSSLYAQQPVDYDDVAVLMNLNDSTSIVIGEYFAAQRSVPQQNLIYVTAPARETINPAEFQEVRTQVESYLQTNDLVDKINYIVTTKGVPLRVSGTGSGLDVTAASFDAELTLILSHLAAHIGEATLVNGVGQVNVQPYYNSTERFSRARYGIYLVTRLTALTRERVLELIDRSGPNTVVNKDSALFVLDYDPTRNGSGYKRYNDNMLPASSFLQNENWNVLLDQDTVFVTDQRNVLGYVSWGSNDNHDHLYTTKARPRNHWLPGSIAETYVSTGARNFQPGQESGQSRIADLFEEGCTGASGYVYEPYTLALAWVNILFPRYVSGNYLADSFYMSLPTFSWMAIVVGDPKTTIISGVPEMPDPVLQASYSECQNEAKPLKADNLVRGLVIWFYADIPTVKAAGPPFDASHPNFASADSIFYPQTSNVGSFIYTVMNENITGRGFAQTEFIVVPGLNPGFSVSVETVYLNEDPTVAFADTSTGATSWIWDFDDGTGTSTIKNPAYTFTSVGNFRVKLTVGNGVCTKTVYKVITVAAERPNVEITATKLDFGEVQISTYDEKDVSIINNQSLPISVQQLSIQGLHPSDFSIEGVTAPFSIAASSQRTFTVRFTPTEKSLRSAQVSIVYLAQGGPQVPASIALIGEGTPAPNSIDPAPAKLNRLTLHQNYPNPFNPVTTITYTLPARDHVTIIVYDAMGKERAIVVDEVQDAGSHGVLWDASKLPSGVYVYKLYSSSGVRSKTMTILK
jgi:uncharacterized protein (TIGR03790 family)